MKIKQLKEKTIKGFMDFLPKIGINDIEGLLNALNDKLSKSEGGEVNKPIAVTNKDSDYKTIINPDGSIYVLNKNTNNTVFSLINTDRGVIINNNVYAPIRINRIDALYDKHGNALYSGTSNIFHANGFAINNGTNNQILLGDGTTTSRVVSYICTSPQSDAYIVNIINIDGANDSFTILGATKELAGLMTAADKTKLDDVPYIYAEKSKTISNITVSNRSNKRGLYMAIDYADRTNPGTTVNIPNATTTSDGCMSYEDKNKLDNIENTYISSQNGNVYTDYDSYNGVATLDISGDYNIEGSGGRIRLKHTEDGKGKMSIMIDGTESSVNAEKFNSIVNPNKNEVWCTDGSRLNILTLLLNAAIYVAGEFELAESGIDNTTVIDSPNSIIFDEGTKRFLARKSLICYTHWKADISKNIAPPSRYGIETDDGVFPFNNQMYKFSSYDNIFIATYSNGTCSMKKLTLK